MGESDITITDSMIRLGQFLKLAGVVEDGSGVKDLLADGAVTVDGEPEQRRGRQLTDGAVIELDLPQGRMRLVLRAQH